MAEMRAHDSGFALATNPEPRCPCILLLDVSRSMAGEPVAALNEGLLACREELASDSLTAQRIEIAVVTFGGTVETVSPFVVAEKFVPPALHVQGDTPMGAAILHAIEQLAARKSLYKRQALPYFRPWLFLITDGAPTDDWQAAREAVHRGESERAFTFHTVGVHGARMDILAQIGPRKPLALDGLRFRDLFVWLSRSLRSVSRARAGEDDSIPFANPIVPGGWAKLTL